MMKIMKKMKKMKKTMLMTALVRVPSAGESLHTSLRAHGKPHGVYYMFYCLILCSFEFAGPA